MKLIINVTITYSHVVDGETRNCTYGDLYKYVADTIDDLPQRFHEIQLEKSFKQTIGKDLINTKIDKIEWDKDTIKSITEKYCYYYQKIITEDCKKCDIHCIQNTNPNKPNYLHEKS